MKVEEMEKEKVKDRKMDVERMVEKDEEGYGY